MSLFFFICAMACLLGVVASLFGGLVAMGRAKSKASNRLMQARVWLQGLAVAFLLLSYLAR